MRNIICVFLCCIACCGCISVKVGKEEVMVYDKYPVYPVADKPALDNLPGNLLNPYKAAALYIQQAWSDGKLTDEEKAEIDRLLKQAASDSITGLTINKGNYDKLIRWGRSNQATVESYNKYADTKNERLKEVK